jgi:hypothetical protein
MSFAISFISEAEASISIHSRIAIVVLVGTAFDTMFTPLCRLDFEQISFIWCSPPGFIKYSKIYVIFLIGAVNM